MINMTTQLDLFAAWLKDEEKSRATVEKYLGVVRAFLRYAGDAELEKELLIAYRDKLKEDHAPTGVNAILAGLNSFLKFLGKEDCRVKNLKVQRQFFAREEEDLSLEEYARLLKAAEGKRIYYIMRTICETGIRVSELQFITVESLRNGKAYVDCKNKSRCVILPEETCKMLREYARQQGILYGRIFITKNRNAIDRTTIWREMQSLCEKAGVEFTKAHPHNLRHLFAKTFYEAEKDISRLADMLGHSSILTTQLYLKSVGLEHRKGLERTQKVLAAAASW